jgi:hypothetical protein
MRAEVDLMVRRTRNVPDGHGNNYGIIEVSPEPDVPAILLGVRFGATGERFGFPVRQGDRVTHAGLDLQVVELVSEEPAWLRLVGSVPA